MGWMTYPEPTPLCLSGKPLFIFSVHFFFKGCLSLPFVKSRKMSFADGSGIAAFVFVKENKDFYCVCQTLEFTQAPLLQRGHVYVSPSVEAAQSTPFCVRVGFGKRISLTGIDATLHMFKRIPSRWVLSGGPVAKFSTTRDHPV